MKIIRLLSALSLLSTICLSCPAQTVENIRYGDFSNWVCRRIKESAVLGGKTKEVFEIAPTDTITGNIPYTNKGGSPWATSNVYAKVAGISKTSNAVFPYDRGNGNLCARLCTKMESVKVLGVINLDVLVAGSIFLGEMMEPISNTKNPYSKMEMGVAFSRRPQYIRFDYMLHNPGTGILTYANGFSTRQQQGDDMAEVFLILQKRYEDSDGNLFAYRVGTARERFETSTDGWINGYRIKINYGNIKSMPGYEDYMDLIPQDKNYYARNSSGKMVPVKEIDWADADETPTHMLIMASSGCGTAYVGAVGMEFYIDNISLEY